MLFSVCFPTQRLSLQYAFNMSQPDPAWMYRIMIRDPAKLGLLELAIVETTARSVLVPRSYYGQIVAGNTPIRSLRSHGPAVPQRGTWEGRRQMIPTVLPTGVLSCGFATVAEDARQMARNFGFS